MAMTEQVGAVTCIVLSPRTGEVDEQLRILLEGSGWRWETHHDPRTAFVELCLIRKALDSRAGWVLTEATRPVLVVIDPGRWPDLAELGAAVTRYLPEISVWLFEDGALTRVPLSEEPVEEPPPVPPGPLPSSEPLTSEEISMLLGDRAPEDEP